MLKEILSDINEGKFIDHRYAQKEWALAAKMMLPLAPSILKDFEKEVKGVYHVCKIEDLKNIIKMQGKRRDIATFSKGSSGISHGTSGVADVMVILDGKTSFSAELDFNSILDRNGYRWLGLYSGKEYVVNNKFSVKMRPLMEKYLGVYRHQMEDTVFNMTGKEKAKFIKWYYDTSKKMLTKKLLKEIADDLAKGFEGGFNNDEILLHNFKIKGIYIIDPEVPRNEYSRDNPNVTVQAKKLLMQKLKIPYTGIITSSKIAQLGR